MKAASLAYAALKQTKLSDIASSKPVVIALPGNTTIEKALEVLREHGINGAPVLNEHGLVRGFVDYLDIATYVMTASDMQQAFNAPVMEAVEKSGKDPLVQISTDTSASMIVRVFAEGVHRSPITAHDGTITNVLTQSDILRLLVSKIKQNEELRVASQASLDSLKLGEAVDVVMDQNTPMQQVVLALQPTHPAIPLTDDSGAIVGAVDGTCLQAFHPTHLEELQQPALAYLQAFYPQALSAVVVNGDTSLSACVEVLASKGVHRVWIVDAQRKPLASVTGTEIFRHIAKGLVAHARAD